MSERPKYLKDDATEFKCKLCKNVLEISTFYNSKGNFHRACQPCRKLSCEKTNAKLRRLRDETMPKIRTRKKDMAVYKILKSLKQKAKDENTLYTLTESDVIIPDSCPILHIPLITGHPQRRYWPSIDRIDPTKGYVKDNIIVVSYRANRLKSETIPEDGDKLIAFYEKQQNFDEALLC